MVFFMSSVPPSIVDLWHHVVKEIRFHDEQYFQKDAPLISDEEYDALVERLKELEKEYPALKTMESPEENVGYDPTGGDLPTVEHIYPLFSLEKVLNGEQLEAFFSRAHRFLSLSQDVVMPWMGELKMDGLTIVLRYENGSLVRGSTRGNGTLGEDITSHVKNIPCIPHTISPLENVPSVMEIQGEAFMTYAAFQEMNEERERNGLPLFANSRNAAAGSLRQLDPSMVGKRKIHFVAHGVNPPIGKSYVDAVELFEKWGMPTPEKKLCHTLEACKEYVAHVEQKRAELPYAIDGIVFKLTEWQWRTRLGHSAKAPRYAVAYKFLPPESETLLEDIGIQVGRTGILTPVAFLKPVLVGGALISKASLHNEDEVRRKDVRKGDIVLVQRAGDVIPQVVRVVKREHTNPPFCFPTECPVCHGEVFRAPGKSVWRCMSGMTCAVQRVWRVRHFVSRDAMNLEGLGKKRLTLLYEKNFVQTPLDLFTLSQKREALCALPGWGSLLVENILEEIRQKSHLSFERFLYGLGIPTIGKSIAVLLAQHYETPEKLMDAMEASLGSDTVEDIGDIEGVGPTIVQELMLFFHNPQQRQMVHDILSFLTIVPAAPSRASSTVESPFRGKRVVFTGKLHKITRAEAKNAAEFLGAKVMSSISSSTDFVIVGEDAGKKLQEAHAHGCTIVQEEEWMGYLTPFLDFAKG